jgi:hypothetical protein
VGPANDSHPAVSTYHRLLVWDIEKAPKVTRYADRVLNPLVGKSLVVYLEKPTQPETTTAPVAAETLEADTAPGPAGGTGLHRVHGSRTDVEADADAGTAGDADREAVA